MKKLILTIFAIGIMVTFITGNLKDVKQSDFSLFNISKYITMNAYGESSSDCQHTLVSAGGSYISYSCEIDGQSCTCTDYCQSKVCSKNCGYSTTNCYLVTTVC